MDITTSPYLLYYSATFAYILSAVFCAAVRWGHMCSPYNQNNNYFYPARRQVTFFYLTMLLQFPYLLNITSEASWQYVRVFGILFYPLCSSIMFLRFFRGESKHKYMKRLVISFLPSIMLILLFLNSVIGSILSESGLQKAVSLSVAISLFQMLFWSKISIWLLQQVRIHNQNRYSNTEDFPVNLALKAILIVSFLIVAMWSIFLFNNRMWKACIDIICTIIQVSMLIVILPPHWSLQKTEEDNLVLPSNETEALSKADKNDQRMKEMEEKAIQLIHEKQLYRNKNLKIDDVARLLNTNSTYLYNVFSHRKEGTFYQLINELRIEYCKQLLLEYPYIKHEELVGRAGINSTSTFYRLFKNHTGQTPNKWLKEQQELREKEGK